MIAVISLAATLLAASDAVPAASPAPVSSVAATRVTGAPLVIDGTAYGTASNGGPNGLDPGNTEAYDSGDGVVYAMDARGSYRVVYAFDGKPLAHPAGGLVLGPDGDLYGEAADNGGIAIFRYDLKKSSIGIVRAFPLEGEKTIASPLAIDRDGSLALVVGDFTYDGGASRLFRVQPDGRITVLHAFSGQRFLAGSLAVGADDSLSGEILSDYSAIVFTVSLGGRYRELYSGAYSLPDVPSRGLVSARGTLYGLSHTTLIAIDATGRRRIVAREAEPGSKFLGEPAPRPDGSFDALEGTKAGTRIRRIASNGAMRTIASVSETVRERYTLEETVVGVMPRLTEAPDGVWVTTLDGKACGNGAIVTASDADRTCGSVQHFGVGGTLDGFHDFTIAPRVTDGGSFGVEVGIDSLDRTLKVEIEREERSKSSAPFSVDPSALTVTLVPPSGSLRTTLPIAVGVVGSHGVGLDGSGRYRDEADVDVRLPDDIPSSLYGVRVVDGGGIRDSKGESIAGPRTTSLPSAYIPSAADSDATLARDKFMGKTVFGYQGGIAMSCTKDGNVFGIHAASAELVDVRRTSGGGAYVEYGGSVAVEPETNLTALDPLIVTFARPSHIDGASFESESSLSNARRTAAMANPASVCSTFEATYAGLWDLERAFSLRSVAAHTDWPAALRDAVTHGRIQLGMTPEMVAYLWGFPTLYGTAEELERLDDWPYDSAAPFGHEARFTNGLLTSFDPPGNLP